jgi:hypothetical protein
MDEADGGLHNGMHYQMDVFTHITRCFGRWVAEASYVRHWPLMLLPRRSRALGTTVHLVSI